MGIAPDAIRITDLIRGLLDRSYFGATNAVIRAIVGNSTGGVIDRRLTELEAEALRLDAAGLPLTLENPVVVALMTDLEGVVKANAVLVDSVAGAVQQAGINAAGPIVRQLALPGMTDAQLAQLGIQWNTPSPEAVNALVGFVGNPAFETKLAKFVDGTLGQVQNVLIQGMVAGKGPVAIARDLQNLIPGLSSSNAQQLLRTLQLTSFREAQRVNRMANAHILEYQIRIAALDDRTCMSCVALHGEILPIDARIDDHHRGRCTSVTKIKGLPAPDVESGANWFGRRSEEQQRAQMGNAAFDAWKAGEIKLSDFPKVYEDALFGRMIGQNSLVGILGRRIDERPDYMTEAHLVVPGLLNTGLDSEVAMVMSDFLAYTPEGVPIYSAEALRMGTVDLFLDMRQIGRVDPFVGQVDLIRMRAAGILATDAQLALSTLSKAEKNSLLKLVSTDYNTAYNELTKIRDLRLKGQARGRVGGYQGEDFLSAQDVDNILRLLEMNQ